MVGESVRGLLRNDKVSENLAKYTVVTAVKALNERDLLILTEQINSLDLLIRFFFLHFTYRCMLSEAMMGKTDLAV